MTEQVQLELIRAVPPILAATFSFCGTLAILWVGAQVKGVHKLVNSVLASDRETALKVSEDKAVAAHAKGMKEEKDKHGVNSPLQ